MRRLYSFIVLLLICFFFFPSTSVYGNERDSLHVEEFQVWSDGAEVEQHLEDMSYHRITVKGSDRKGGGVAVLYNHVDRDWSNYTGFTMHITNYGKEDILFNFQTSISENLVLPLSNFIGIKPDNITNWETVYSVHDHFSLPAHFEGKVFIPFDNLEQVNGKLEESQTWSLVLLVDQGDKNEVKVGEFMFPSKDRSEKLYQDLQLKIIGEEEIQIPVAGESIATYNVQSATTNDISLSLEEEITGVSISENGTLILKPSVEVKEIGLVATSSNGTTTKKKIKLVESWFTGKTTDDGVSLEIPIEEKNTSELVEWNLYLNNERNLQAIQTALIILTLILIIVYRLCRKKANKHIQLDKQ
ncbi:hypothetical protein JOC85_002502 [Bacillus mesophilus]|uniref:Uncharacterized protein n=1 Tax=Bacillus mesophilus TaxID=1808955 RepID=A0A6M0Q7N1_9BACI|nr:hypothetical protein [Bacillus mesophilus]MBM7661699.1 hypothetical protein [Bacillus mesophilus]NEY72361.1 hypothetical protein [Bacillus mesophilus]